MQEFLELETRYKGYYYFYTDGLKSSSYVSFAAFSPQDFTSAKWLPL